MGLNLHYQESKNQFYFLQTFNSFWIAKILYMKQKAEGNFFYKLIISIQTTAE